MFKLISDDLPTTALPAQAQSSTNLIRLWEGSSRSMAPVATCNYTVLYANAIGLQPIVYHAIDPIYSGLHYKYTFPFTVTAISVTGSNEVDPKLATPHSFWFNTDTNTVHMYRASKSVGIAVEMAVSATAIATNTPNIYRIDTSLWGTFTSPSPIAVDGILFPYSATLGIPGTYAIDANIIFIYPTAPFPVGATLLHLQQDLELEPIAAIATYELPEFTLVSDFAGRTYLRALDLRSPKTYEFLSDDDRYISLYMPTSLFAGTQVEQPEPVNGMQVVSSITYNS
jgi:hypothetical protein